MVNKKCLRELDHDGLREKDGWRKTYRAWITTTKKRRKWLEGTDGEVRSVKMGEVK